MELDFFKYNGTGNDFIILDYRKKIVKKNDIFLFKKLCDRHFGIGANGVILIQNDHKSSFYMKYFNSDGRESTMCGNGGRCAILFSKKLGFLKKDNEKIHFKAIDGYHHGFIINKNVSISLLDIKKKDIKIYKKHIILNTGSPHYIVFVEKMKNINVYEEGKKIRFNNEYFEKGINVNFVEVLNNKSIQVRTYERGVENETLSCGTGVTASVIAACEINKINEEKILVNTLGGNLSVSLKKNKNIYKNIYLTGSVNFIFKGYINI
ncbi:diaminopimelate epimerase [Blattabacterium cuenoti]|uniref:diaminopimelate epimerase n=1 Tax=Blattabacterium cuenoti TaxID=1653831 RepID=UPI00163C584F|nr:diaminopimelate epimerase [Blattabacterium cuenoti]